MRTDEYQIAIDLHSKGASTEKEEIVRLAKEASHDAKYAQMSVKFIMENYKLTFVQATGIISLFIICTFELLGVMIGADYKKYRAELSRYGVDLHKNKEIKYLKKDFKRQKKKDKEIRDYNLNRAKEELKALKENAMNQNKLQLVYDEIKGHSAYGHYAVSPSTPVETSTIKMGFIDTNNKTQKNKIAPDLMQSNVIPAPAFSGDIGVLSMEGLSLEELLHRRDENVRVRGDFPICPACSMIFARRTWQDVFCPDTKHGQEFNNQLRRLRRARQKENR